MKQLVSVPLDAMLAEHVELLLLTSAAFRRDEHMHGISGSHGRHVTTIVAA